LRLFWSGDRLISLVNNAIFLCSLSVRSGIE
jgi:hypothetical protein